MKLDGSSAAPARTSRWLRCVRNESLQAAFVLLLEIAAFLWIPLSRYPDVYFSAADLTQAFSLTRTEPGHQPGNQLQSDAVTQMLPWSMFNGEELREGRLPLWNPWNAAGCPHFANFQSSVFSPFVAPFYVFSFKFALVLSAALKLFALGFFTYLFLRKIDVGHWAALVGATIFTFAGHNTLLLYFPHVGAMVALPAGLYCLETALRRWQRARDEGHSASFRTPLAGLTIVLLAGLLAGNPEPFYFSMILIGAYALARLTVLWRASSSAAVRLDLAKLAGKLAFASALAAGLAAFQILPFFEYLENSRVIEQRSLRQTPLESTWWPLAFFPDVLGNPSSPYKLSDNVPPPNYELVVVAYTGAAAMVMALFSLVFARRSGYAWFFAISGAIWVVYAYDVFGATDLFLKLPTLDMAPMNRSQGVWNFIVACAAALCVEFASRADGKRRFGAVFLLFCAGVAAWVACLVGADALIEKYSTFPSPNRDLFLKYVPDHVRSMSLLFATTLSLLVVVWLARTRIVRTTGTIGIVVCCFLATGWLFHTYNPTCENRFSFPVTPAIQTLQEKVGSERLAILGEDMIPPASNLAYRIQTISNYDAMWVRDFDLLFRDHFGDGNNWRPLLKGSKRSLRIFGVQYVLAKWGWNWIDSGLQGFGKDTSLLPIRREILPGQEVVQTFRSRLDGLRAVMLQLSTFRKHTPCDLHFELEDVATGRVVASRTLTSEEIQSSVFAKRHVVWPREFQLDPAGRPVVIRFEPELSSHNRDYRITLSCPTGKPGDTICAWSMPKSAYHEGESHHGPTKLEGEIIFDWSYLGDADFEPIAEFEDFVLYRFREARPRFSIVREAVEAETDEKALEFLRVQSFDPDLLVVLGPNREDDSKAARVLAPTRRRVVQFTDNVYVYLVAPDGKRLAHIDDEVTFIANGLDWKSIETLPPSARYEFEIIDDKNREAKRRAGLILLEPSQLRSEPIQVQVDEPSETRLHIENTVPGYLVLDRAHFPGWRCEIDGDEYPLLRANYAFSAIPLPVGEYDVRIWYQPSSLSRGLWIGLLCLALGIGSLWRSPRRANRVYGATTTVRAGR